MPYKNPEDRRKWARKWYSQHKDFIKKQVRNRKQSLWEWIRNYKISLKCSQCSENHPATLDFHHKNHKEFSINYMVANGYSPDKIKNEMKKCIVLCSNCHRKLHYRNKKL